MRLNRNLTQLVTLVGVTVLVGGGATTVAQASHHNNHHDRQEQVSDHHHNNNHHDNDHHDNDHHDNDRHNDNHHNNNNHHSNNNANNNNGSTAASVDKSYQNGDSFNQVKLDNIAAGNVEFKVGDAYDVAVKDTTANPITLTKDGSKLVVKQAGKAAGNASDYAVTITVPSATALKSADVKVGNGQVQISGLNFSDKSAIISNSGQVKIDNSTFNGLTFNANNNNVEINDSAVNKLIANGNSSQVTLNNTNLTGYNKVNGNNVNVAVNGDADNLGVMVKGAIVNADYQGTHYSRSFAQNMTAPDKLNVIGRSIQLSVN